MLRRELLGGVLMIISSFLRLGLDPRMAWLWLPKVSALNCSVTGDFSFGTSSSTCFCLETHWIKDGYSSGSLVDFERSMKSTVKLTGDLLSSLDKSSAY